MATVTGLTLVKSFTYRDIPGEEFQSGYHFKSSPPGDDASWMVLLNDVLAAERLIYPASVSWVRAYGYDSDDPAANHVFSHDWTVPGPPPLGTGLTPPDGHLMAGDQAATVRWVTDALTSKGKPIYLRKYIHHGYVHQTDPDKVQDPAYRAELQTYGETIRTMYGGLRSRARDLNATVTEVSPWVTTRTLKHRGKRGGPASRAGSA